MVTEYLGPIGACKHCFSGPKCRSEMKRSSLCLQTNGSAQRGAPRSWKCQCRLDVLGALDVWALAPSPADNSSQGPGLGRGYSDRHRPVERGQRDLFRQSVVMAP